MISQNKLVRCVVAAVALCVAASLTGCDGFFFKESSTSGGGAGSGDYVYVGNEGSTSITGFGISSTGQIAPVTSSSYALPSTPLGLAVTPNNQFLYVATQNLPNPGIYGFTIASNGTLTPVANGQSLNTGLATLAVTVSPDGQWLATANIAGYEIYRVNGDGTLAAQGGFPYTPASPIPSKAAVAISPNGQFFYVALGSLGLIAYEFNTSTGVVSSAVTTVPTTGNENAIAVSADNTVLYTAVSGPPQGIEQYSINSGGALTFVSTFSAGNVPEGVTLASGGSFLYAANLSDNTLSGYTVNPGGSLVPLSSAPFQTGSAPTAVTTDSTGNFVVAVSSGGSPDVTVYAFDSTQAGRIYTVSSAASGTTPSLIASTH